MDPSQLWFGQKQQEVSRFLFNFSFIIEKFWELMATSLTERRFPLQSMTRADQVQQHEEVFKEKKIAPAFRFVDHFNLSLN